jgi:hypothetical protein
MQASFVPCPIVFRFEGVGAKGTLEDPLAGLWFRYKVVGPLSPPSSVFRDRTGLGQDSLRVARAGVARTEEAPDCRDDARRLRLNVAVLLVSAKAAAMSSMETCSSSGGELRQRSRELIVLKLCDRLVFEL